LKPFGFDEFRAALTESTSALLGVVLAAADAQGSEVYAVGGPVRDLLLGQPVRDLDLVVAVEGAAVSNRSGASELSELAEAAAREHARVSHNERFGAYLLRGADADVDLAQARRETYAHPGALPKVESGSLEEDLLRRDFAVNAMALPLSKAALARHAGIVDLTEGIDDLARKRLRVLHGRSFHDDPTRILRAARLAARLEFSLARGSRSALRAALREGAFGRVSGDRLRRELVKLIDDARMGVDPARSLRMLSDWHVLGVLEPGLTLPRESVAPLRRIGRAVAEAPWRAARWRAWVSAMCVWLAPLEPPLRRRALARFSVRGDVARRILAFPKSRDSWLKSLGKARGRGAIDAILAPLSDEELHALYASAEPTARRRIARWASEDRLRRIPLNGEDLIEIGLEGPVVGRALVRIRTAFLDGTVSGREEAIALAREIGRRNASRQERIRKKGTKKGRLPAGNRKGPLGMAAPTKTP
jgi:tRNA nucleotidyltransferase (CCA-adding enzyme)